MASESEEWPEPGTTQHSFLNPAGPFRPLRRIVTYLTVIAVVAMIGLPALGVPAGVLAVFAVGPLLTAWAALWFIDTILAYLKN
jgi:hypothetical protein